MRKHRGHRLRRGRISAPGQIYLVTTVTHLRYPLFDDLPLGRIVVKAMRHQHDAGDVSSLSFVIMPDHLHWLFELGEGRDLSAVVNRMKTWTAKQVNLARDTGGKVWQQGFHDHAVRHHEDIRAVARYVVANPLRAGLVDDIAKYSLWDAAWVEGNQVL